MIAIVHSVAQYAAVPGVHVLGEVLPAVEGTETVVAGAGKSAFLVCFSEVRGKDCPVGKGGVKRLRTIASTTVTVFGAPVRVTA
jgi:hypothetical protein